MAVAVRGGVVTSVEFAGEEFTVVPPLPERFVPVEELFIDYAERMADEETRFVVRGFTLR